ncbi:MAG: OsmC family protein [Thermoplasmata archaeon]|nr:OsmC family protein [Thermoplasmata archaeon]
MAIEASGVWQGGFRTRLEDDRGHAVTVDLPSDEDGQDSGTSALELSVLSLAGCVVTIFLLVARRRRLPLEAASIQLKAERRAGAPTIESVDGVLTVRSTATDEDVATALRLTLKTCPVGVLFERAGVPVRVRVVRETPTQGTTPLAEGPARAAPFDQTS